MKVGPVGISLLALALLAALYLFSRATNGTVLVLDEGPQLRVGDHGESVLELPRRVRADAVGESDLLRYRMVDLVTMEPIVGGRIYDVRTGAVLALTGADGDAELVGEYLNTLVFGADGYLSEHYFDRPEAVRLIRDAWSSSGHLPIFMRADTLTLPHELRFLAVDGGPAKGVVFHLVAVEPGTPSASELGTDPEMQAAWDRHVLLNTIDRRDFTPEFLHFGHRGPQTEFTADGESVVRFAFSGRYRLEARAGDQFRRQDIEVRAARGGVTTVQLQRGRFFGGTLLRRSDDQPVVGAHIILLRGRVLVADGRSDYAGRFELGPMEAEGLELRVEHPGMETLTLDQVFPGGVTATVYHLVPKESRFVKGVVLRRSDRVPIAGATVRLTDGTSTLATRETDGQGRFVLNSAELEPHLTIEAEGYRDYVETLNANGVERQFELIPSVARVRFETGLTALVEGSVLDAAGNPLPGHVISISPVDRAPPQGFAERRILRGGTLPRPSRVESGEAGEFRFEWPIAEEIRLAAGERFPERNLRVIPGQRVRLELRANR